MGQLVPTHVGPATVYIDTLIGGDVVALGFPKTSYIIHPCRQKFPHSIDIAIPRASAESALVRPFPLQFRFSPVGPSTYDVRKKLGLFYPIPCPEKLPRCPVLSVISAVCY